MTPRTEEAPEEFGEELYQNEQTDDDGEVVVVRVGIWGVEYAPKVERGRRERSGCRRRA